jgi:drug/metabolite transporter superfamily protein YnfA
MGVCGGWAVTAICEAGGCSCPWIELRPANEWGLVSPDSISKGSVGPRRKPALFFVGI